MKCKPHSERGSAIIWIFIAVGLFGALAYAFMGTSRTSTNMISKEAAVAQAREIIAYAEETRAAVQRLLLRGCQESEVSFVNTVILRIDGVIYHGSHTPSPPNKCRIYLPEGGGLQPRVFTNAAEFSVSLGPAQAQHGAAQINDAIWVGAGTGAPDLILTVRPIKKEICTAMNDLLGVPNRADGFPPVDNMGGANTSYFGDGFNGTGTVGDGESAAEMRAKKESCRDNGGNTFNYAKVIMAR